MSEFIQKFIVDHLVECPYCDGTGSSEFGDECCFCLGSGWVDDLIELGLRRDDGHVSFAAGGLLAACAVDVWLMVRWPWLITAWLALFFMIALLYRWYGARLRKQDAYRHRHVFDTLRDEKSGFAVLACKCGAPYCLVRIVR